MRKQILSKILVFSLISLSAINISFAESSENFVIEGDFSNIEQSPASSADFQITNYQTPSNEETSENAESSPIENVENKNNSGGGGGTLPVKPTNNDNNEEPSGTESNSDTTTTTTAEFGNNLNRLFKIQEPQAIPIPSITNKPQFAKIPQAKIPPEQELAIAPQPTGQPEPQTETRPLQIDKEIQINSFLGIENIDNSKNIIKLGEISLNSNRKVSGYANSNSELLMYLRNLENTNNKAATFKTNSNKIGYFELEIPSDLYLGDYLFTIVENIQNNTQQNKLKYQFTLINDPNAKALGKQKQLIQQRTALAYVLIFLSMLGLMYFHPYTKRRKKTHAKKTKN